MTSSPELSVVERIENARRQAAVLADHFDDPAAYRAGLEQLAAILREELPSAVGETTARWVGYLRHELAQPMSVLTGVNETLLAHGSDLDDDSRRVLLQRAQRQILLMQLVLTQLERAYRLESGSFEVHPEQLNLEATINDVVEDFQPLFEPVDVDVECDDGGLTGCVDPSALAEILAALLRNATTHAPCDDPVLIEVRDHDQAIWVSVHDDGEGIPEEDRNRIFERGERLDTDVGGRGLGLFIARGLARAHDGDLTVTRSERLGGCRFDLDLPSSC